MTGSRRRYGSSFKIDVVRKVESGLSAAQVARRYQLSPHLVYKWLRLYRENPEKAFKRGGSREFENLDTEARVAELERKVGSLTMENEFLKKVLERLESNGGAKIPMDGER
ncbi:MAG: transposase [Candidatus Marinimicrobia bacterium]|nr:transposase [Candidatus Neomarinimicrobiota bacterium]